MLFWNWEREKREKRGSQRVENSERGERGGRERRKNRILSFALNTRITETRIQMRLMMNRAVCA